MMINLSKKCRNLCRLLLLKIINQKTDPFKGSGAPPYGSLENCCSMVLSSSVWPKLDCCHIQIAGGKKMRKKM